MTPVHNGACDLVEERRYGRDKQSDTCAREYDHPWKGSAPRWRASLPPEPEAVDESPYKEGDSQDDHCGWEGFHRWTVCRFRTVLCLLTHQRPVGTGCGRDIRDRHLPRSGESK